MEDKIMLVITAISGLLGVPIIQFVKKQFNLKDKPALAIATGVSLALGLVVVILGGEFAGADLNLENVGGAFTAVFTFATIVYKAFLGDKSG